MRPPPFLLLFLSLFCWIESIFAFCPLFLVASSNHSGSSASTPGGTTNTAVHMSSPSNSGHLVLSWRHVLADGHVGLILASASPRRREILDMMGLSGLYTVTPSPLDETALQGQLAATITTAHPPVYAQTLAEQKAYALATTLHTVVPTLVLGSDTIVVDQEEDQKQVILEKPVDQADARRMLQQLSGRAHCVHTGVAVYLVRPNDANATTTKLTSWVDQATVHFATLTDADIDAYIHSGEPLDKAGAYGIQGMGGQLVRHVEGDFFTVMGLPMHRTSQALAAAIQSCWSEETT